MNPNEKIDSHAHAISKYLAILVDSDLLNPYEVLAVCLQSFKMIAKSCPMKFRDDIQELLDSTKIGLEECFKKQDLKQFNEQFEINEIDEASND